MVPNGYNDHATFPRNSTQLPQGDGAPVDRQHLCLAGDFLFIANASNKGQYISERVTSSDPHRPKWTRIISFLTCSLLQVHWMACPNPITIAGLALPRQPSKAVRRISGGRCICKGPLRPYMCGSQCHLHGIRAYVVFHPRHIGRCDSHSNLLSCCHCSLREIASWRGHCSAVNLQVTYFFINFLT